jgi:oxalate decarboxylase
MKPTDDQDVVLTIRGKDGASVLGPDNVPIGLQNPGAPWTDSGSLPNLKFPYAAAHNRCCRGLGTRDNGTRVAGRDDHGGCEHAAQGGSLP